MVPLVSRNPGCRVYVLDHWSLHFEARLVDPALRVVALWSDFGRPGSLLAVKMRRELTKYVVG